MIFHFSSDLLPCMTRTQVELRVVQILTQVLLPLNVERPIMKMSNYPIEVPPAAAHHHCGPIVMRTRSYPLMFCMPLLNQEVLSLTPKAELGLQFQNHIVKKSKLRQILKMIMIKVIQEVSRHGRGPSLL